MCIVKSQPTRVMANNNVFASTLEQDWLDHGLGALDSSELWTHTQTKQFQKGISILPNKNEANVATSTFKPDCVDTNTEFINSQSNRKQRSVQFVEVPEIREVPSFKDLDRKYVRKLWYSRREFMIMQLKSEELISDFDKMKKSAFRLQDEEEDSMRGLEGYTREGAVFRHECRRSSMKVVFWKQEDQAALGVKDAEDIAKIYEYHSSISQKRAIILGERDELDIKSYVSAK